MIFSTEAYTTIQTLGAAFLGTIGVVAAAYINTLKRENKELKKKNKDLSQELVFDLSTFNEINHIIADMFQTTKSDRFLILAATNGTTELRQATVLYEQHYIDGESKAVLSLGATQRYKNYQFDSHYLQTLKRCEIEKNGVFFDVAEMPECDLKSIYELEQVKYSSVHFLSRNKIDTNNDRLFYCSVATHNPTNYCKQGRTLIHGYVNQVKNKLKEITQI
jgi:hypothetical protein